MKLRNNTSARSRT